MKNIIIYIIIYNLYEKYYNLFFRNMSPREYFTSIVVYNNIIPPTPLPHHERKRRYLFISSNSLHSNDDIIFIC